MHLQLLPPYALHPTTPTAITAAKKISFNIKENKAPKKPRPEDGALPERAPESPNPARSALRMSDEVVTEMILVSKLD